MARSWLARSAVAFGLALNHLVEGQAAPKVHLIKAGAGGFKFTPQQLLNVRVGDVVTFEFYPPDHSVAQAEYGDACVPYELSHSDKVGFWSETQNVSSVADVRFASHCAKQWLIKVQVTRYNITINSTEPIFFYCAAKGSCTDELMIGAINPNATQTLQGQIDAAKNAKFQVQPGQPLPKEGGASPSESASPHGGSGHKISTTVIVGIAVGIVLFLVLCGALFFFVGRSKSLKEVVKRHDDGATMKPVGVGGGYTELGMAPHHRQSTFPQPPQTPQNPYLQDYGSPLPPYASPYMSHASPHMGNASPHMSVGADTGVQYFNDQKASQPFIAELHSPAQGRHEFAAELEAPQSYPQEKKR
jgi:plastocyanin